MNELHHFLWQWIPPYRWTVKILGRISFPGNKEVNMAEVLGFFFRNLVDESLTSKASAVAFNFFIAVFPAFLFLFNLIPYIPIEGLGQEILGFFQDTIPRNAYETIRGTLEDIITQKRGDLLSFGIVVALYFASNGFSALFDAFDPQGSFWTHKAKAFIMVFVVSFLILLTVGISIGAEYAIDYAYHRVLHLDEVSIWVLKALKWLLVLALTYFTVALVFFVGTPKNQRLHFFSPGAWLTTFSVLLVSYGFGYYVENFGRYNQFYGSLGALIVTMLWMYFCALSLQIWFVYNKTHHQFS